MQPVREKEYLITRLDDALALYDEPMWEELRDILTSEQKSENNTKIWYRANPEKLVKERKVLTKLLIPSQDCPTLFFYNEETGKLGATGFIDMTGGKRVKIEMIFPVDYPESPPRVFFFGPALKKIPQLLREDGSVPVPSGPDQSWGENCNSGMALNWAIEWLEHTMQLQAARLK